MIFEKPMPMQLLINPLTSASPFGFWKYPDRFSSRICGPSGKYPSAMAILVALLSVLPCAVNPTAGVITILLACTQLIMFVKAGLDVGSDEFRKKGHRHVTPLVTAANALWIAASVLSRTALFPMP